MAHGDAPSTTGTEPDPAFEEHPDDGAGAVEGSPGEAPGDDREAVDVTDGEAPAADDTTDSDSGADGTMESDAADGTTVADGAAGADGPTRDSRGGSDVEVPDSLYRIVTVFSTLLSVVFVVVGFSVLDMARTVVSNPRGSLVVQLLALVGSMDALVAARSTVALGVGLLGLGLVAAGAAVFVYGSRFRAAGMGKPKDEADEDSGDG